MSMSITHERTADGARAVDEPARPPGGTEQPRIAQLEHQVEGLSRALQTRDVIGQAKGVLLSRYGMGPDDAFALLVRLSQNTNTKLADLAADLVALVRDHDRGHGRRGPSAAGATSMFDGLLGGFEQPVPTRHLHANDKRGDRR